MTSNSITTISSTTNKIIENKTREAKKIFPKKKNNKFFYNMCKIIEINKTKWFKKIDKLDTKWEIIKIFPYKFEVHQDKNIFVHFKSFIDKGAFKRVTLSLLYNKMKLVAKLKTSLIDYKIKLVACNEEKFLKLLSGKNWIPKTYIIRRTYKYGIPKQLILQKFYPETNLANYLYEVKLDLKQKIDIAIKMAAILSKLHEKKIVHFDIKLENFLLKTKNRNDKKIFHLVLSDFGYAKPLHEKIKRVQGTPIYMSPELLKASYYNKTPPFMDKRKIDIWALGISLHILFYDKEPHWHKRMELCLVNRLIAFEDFISLMRGQINLTPIKGLKPLINLIKKMLHHLPSERPSAETICKELQKIDLSKL